MRNLRCTSQNQQFTDGPCSEETIRFDVFLRETWPHESGREDGNAKAAIPCSGRTTRIKINDRRINEFIKYLNL